MKVGLPDPDEFIEALIETLGYLSEVDDQGSFDWELSRWQDWIKTWPEILDENGSL